MDDGHTALKFQEVAKGAAAGANLVLTKRWRAQGEDYVLHAHPHQYDCSPRMQATDFFLLLGFQRSDECRASGSGRCYYRVLPSPPDLQALGQQLSSAYARLQALDDAMEDSRLGLPKSGGWGYFDGGPDQPHGSWTAYHEGDGHTGQGATTINHDASADFECALTYLPLPHGLPQWILHIATAPQSPPSPQVGGIFDLLGLSRFSPCPETGAGWCRWKSLGSPRHEMDLKIRREAREMYAAVAEKFPQWTQALLEVNDALHGPGFAFLPAAQTKLVGEVDAAPRRRATAPEFEFDVVLSFAGEDREKAEVLAQLLRAEEIRVFYDKWERAALWGSDLARRLDEVYRKKGRYCVIFISEHYADKVWPRHELRSALARALEQAEPYILPVRLDDTDLPGLPPTVAYEDLRKTTIEEIAELVVAKLCAAGQPPLEEARGDEGASRASDRPASGSGTDAPHRVSALDELDAEMASLSAQERSILRRLAKARVAIMSPEPGETQEALDSAILSLCQRQLMVAKASGSGGWRVELTVQGALIAGRLGGEE